MPETDPRRAHNKTCSPSRHKARSQEMASYCRPFTAHLQLQQTISSWASSRAETTYSRSTNQRRKSIMTQYFHITRKVGRRPASRATPAPSRGQMPSRCSRSLPKRRNCCHPVGTACSGNLRATTRETRSSWWALPTPVLLSCPETTR